MLEIALDPAPAADRAYEDLVVKFFEHFALIPTRHRDQGLWDDEDGFYYDRLPPGRRASRCRCGCGPWSGCCRSCAVAVARRARCARCQGCRQAAARPADCRQRTPTPGAVRLRSRPGRRAAARRASTRSACCRVLDAAARRGRVPVALRPAGPVARPTASTRIDLDGGRPGRREHRLRAGRVDDRHVRRQLELARARSGSRSTTSSIEALAPLRALPRRRVPSRVPDRLGAASHAGRGGRRPPRPADLASSSSTPTAAGRASAASTASSDDPTWRDNLLFHEYFHGDNGARPRRLAPDRLDGAGRRPDRHAGGQTGRDPARGRPSGPAVTRPRRRRASGWSTDGLGGYAMGTASGLRDAPLPRPARAVATDSPGRRMIGPPRARPGARRRGRPHPPRDPRVGRRHPGAARATSISSRSRSRTGCRAGAGGSATWCSSGASRWCTAGRSSPWSTAWSARTARCGWSWTPLCTWRDVHGERRGPATAGRGRGGGRVRVRGCLPGRRAGLVSRAATGGVGVRQREEAARGLDRPRGRLARRALRRRPRSRAGWRRRRVGRRPRGAAPAARGGLGGRCGTGAIRRRGGQGGRRRRRALAIAADQFVVAGPDGRGRLSMVRRVGARRDDLLRGALPGDGPRGGGPPAARAGAARCCPRGCSPTPPTAARRSTTRSTGRCGWPTPSGATSPRRVTTDLGAALAPALRAVVDAHVAGTRYGIRVDPADGLLTQGARGGALTWMDARIDGSPVTPRAGKAVEVNALWIEALAVGGGASAGAAAARAADLGAQARGVVRAALRARDGRGSGRRRRTRRRRPGAPPTNAAPRRWRSRTAPLRDAAPVRAARARLLTSLGLRSLAPDEPDYRGSPPRWARRAGRRLPPGHGVAVADRPVRRGVGAHRGSRSRGCSTASRPTSATGASDRCPRQPTATRPTARPAARSRRGRSRRSSAYGAHRPPTSIRRGVRRSDCVSEPQHEKGVRMRATVMYGAGDVRVENVPDARLLEPTPTPSSSSAAPRSVLQRRQRARRNGRGVARPRFGLARGGRDGRVEAHLRARSGGLDRASVALP